MKFPAMDLSPPQPPARTALEVRLLVILGFLVAATTMHQVLMAQGVLAFAIPAAAAAFLCAWFAGTPVFLPLYFLTTFGTVLTLPGLPMSLNRVVAAMLLLAAVLDFLRLGLRVPWNGPLVVFLGTVAYILACAAVLRPPGVAFPTETLFYVLLALLPAARFQERSDFLRLLRRFSFCAVVLLVPAAALELVTRVDLTLAGPGGPAHRINGLAGNAIFYAYTAVWALPIIFLLFLETRNVLAKLWYAGSGFTILFLALATQNRQTPIVLAVVFAVFFALMRYRHRSLLLGLMLGGALLISPFVVGKVIERFSTVGSAVKDTSVGVRYDKMMIAMTMLEAHPWTGVGHTYFKDLWVDYRPLGKMVVLNGISEAKHYIDLGYVQIVAEYGLVGAALFLLLMILLGRHLLQLYRATLRLPEEWPANLVAMLIAYHAHLLVSLLIQDTFITPRTFLLFGMVSAVTVMVERQVALQSGAPAEAPR